MPSQFEFGIPAGYFPAFFMRIQLNKIKDPFKRLYSSANVRFWLFRVQRRSS